jgi:histidyl-tRNA synthetase
MYTFKDRSEEEITLRPEGTAGIIRAIISNGLTHQMPFRAFYSGPMFRYERPQKGRLRQFHQIGIELIGSLRPEADIEVIACACRILEELGIRQDTKLEINSLGDYEDRKNYKNALLQYLNSYKDKLSIDSINRLEKNPLRILDSKDNDDINIIKNAPIIDDYLGQNSKTIFDEIKRGLESLNIKFYLNPKLVRGLDYYGQTTFEFTTEKLGSQGTVMAGGRYNNLMKEMGGPDLAGIGWAAGIERLMLLIQPLIDDNKLISVIPIESKYNNIAFKITEDLRKNFINTDIGFSGNIKKRLSYADKIKSKFAVIIGEEEVNQSAALVKKLDTGRQIKIKFNELSKYFKKILQLK